MTHAGTEFLVTNLLILILTILTNLLIPLLISPPVAQVITKKTTAHRRRLRIMDLAAMKADLESGKMGASTMAVENQQQQYLLETFMDGELDAEEMLDDSLAEQPSKKPMLAAAQSAAVVAPAITAPATALPGGLTTPQPLPATQLASMGVMGLEQLQEAFAGHGRGRGKGKGKQSSTKGGGKGQAQDTDTQCMVLWCEQQLRLLRMILLDVVNMQTAHPYVKQGRDTTKLHHEVKTLMREAGVPVEQILQRVGLCHQQLWLSLAKLIQKRVFTAIGNVQAEIKKIEDLGSEIKPGDQIKLNQLFQLLKDANEKHGVIQSYLGTYASPQALGNQVRWCSISKPQQGATHVRMETCLRAGSDAERFYIQQLLPDVLRVQGRGGCHVLPSIAPPSKVAQRIQKSIELFG